MIDRRRRPRSTTPIGFLEQLPILTVLDRLPMPMIAVGIDDGDLVYTNPASAELLGYADSAAVTDQSLPALMAEHAHTAPCDCVTALMAADGDRTDWNHADGHVIHTIVSKSLLARIDDPVLLVGLTDTTELSWMKGQPHPAEHHPAPGRQ